MPDFRVPFKTTPKIHEIISKIGRTEDVKFSPDNRCIAITELHNNCIHIFKIEVQKDRFNPVVFISAHTLIKSPKFNHPHGLTFLGNNHIVVCNRKGDVSVLRIPDSSGETAEFCIDQPVNINGNKLLLAKVKSPGSVDAYSINQSTYRMLVCNNYWHTVTDHIVSIKDSVRIKNNGVLIENSLKIPDGIAISPDKKWIVVSNHFDGRLLIYENSPELNRSTPPVAALEGPVCPHGIRFTPDGKKLLVVDASSPYLFVYKLCEEGWLNVQKTFKSVRMICDEMFYRGRYGSKEGGLKGIDIDNSVSLLATTHKEDVVAFYNVSMLISGDHEFDKKKIAGFCNQRDRSFKSLKPMLKRRWNISSKIDFMFMVLSNQALSRIGKLKYGLFMKYLKRRNQHSTESLLDPLGPVVSFTSHGSRIDKVFYMVESIGFGYSKPSKIILWINNNDEYRSNIPSLQRLIKRGLEIQLTDDYGPHTKYFPYIKHKKEFNKPLVTADDDIIYPRFWLRGIINAYNENPKVINCYYARCMAIDNMFFAPYSEWKESSSTNPSHTNFIISSSGVVYPPEYLKHLQQEGDLFKHCCPKADDIWLTLQALRSGFKIAQIYNEPFYFFNIPGTQLNRLGHYNEQLGGNQIQLFETFKREDMSKLDSYLNSD